MKEKRKRQEQEPDIGDYAPPGIGSIMKKHYPSAEMQKEPETKERCRFDMFVRWNKKEKRNKYTFTYRGDHFGDIEPAKMLWSLVRMFMNKHSQMFLVELYDNTRQKNDPERIILKYNSGVIVENRLQQLTPLLENFPVADWLINKK